MLVRSYHELIVRAKAHSMNIRRKRNLAIACLKIVYRLSPPLLHDLVVEKDCRYNSRHSYIVDIPQEHFGKNSFEYTADFFMNKKIIL